VQPACISSLGGMRHAPPALQPRGPAAAVRPKVDLVGATPADCQVWLAANPLDIALKPRPPAPPSSSPLLTRLRMQNWAVFVALSEWHQHHHHHYQSNTTTTTTTTTTNQRRRALRYDRPHGTPLPPTTLAPLRGHPHSVRGPGACSRRCGSTSRASRPYSGSPRAAATRPSSPRAAHPRTPDPAPAFMSASAGQLTPRIVCIAET